MPAGRIVLIVILCILAVGMALGIVLMGIQTMDVRDALRGHQVDVFGRSYAVGGGAAGTTLDATFKTQLGATDPGQLSHAGTDIASGIQGVGRGVIPAPPVEQWTGAAGPGSVPISRIMQQDVERHLSNSYTDQVQFAQCLAMMTSGFHSGRDIQQCTKFELPGLRQLADAFERGTAVGPNPYLGLKQLS